MTPRPARKVPAELRRLGFSAEELASLSEAEVKRLRAVLSADVLAPALSLLTLASMVVAAIVGAGYASRILGPGSGTLAFLGLFVILGFTVARVVPRRLTRALRLGDDRPSESRCAGCCSFFASRAHEGLYDSCSTQQGPRSWAFT